MQIVVYKGKRAFFFSYSPIRLSIYSLYFHSPHPSIIYILSFSDISPLLIYFMQLKNKEKGRKKREKRRCKWPSTGENEPMFNVRRFSSDIITRSGCRRGGRSPEKPLKRSANDWKCAGGAGGNKHDNIEG